MADDQEDDLDDDFVYPMNKQMFFEDAWDEASQVVVRADLRPFVYFISGQMQWSLPHAVLTDIEVEAYLEAILNILRHPERDPEDLHIAAPGTPTWQWFGRLLLAAAEQATGPDPDAAKYTGDEDS